ncbi:SDR family oxidoreductase [Devosia rhodophyticola]|uniref:SDR family oxidoreductase n=1 Tax=Devosia rhodophyticola TaxID=3026423 RepID=A0ABY7YXF3_9HYPH|nr:SDR family oxidoreductase [Devosia rhodophyticola]WDR06065.1 SDR family oxidoreductase [Devosia rhodophyticola]
MTLPLRDKFALITGASHGIGKATALALADAGANIAFTYRGSEFEAREVSRQIEAVGRKVFMMHAELMDIDDCKATAIEAIKTFGQIDVLVNNAGGGQYSAGPLAELSLDSWERGLNLNLRAPFITSQLIAQNMVERGQGGSIINISSIHSRSVWFDSAAYGVAKAGLNRLTKSMAVEWAAHGIRANAVAPGYINTSETPEERARYDAGDNLAAPLIAMQRTALPSEIASLCVFLASDAASYITGQTIFADGGVLLPPVTVAHDMRAVAKRS